MFGAKAMPFTEWLRNGIFLMLPPIQLWWARWRLNRRLRTQADVIAADPRYAEWLSLPTEILDDLIFKERARASAIEDKATRVTAVLAIALTIGGTLAKPMIDNINGPHLKMIVQIGMPVAMAYLVTGGLVGLFSGSRARRQSGYGPDWEVELQNADLLPKGLRVRTLIEFEISNLMRTNELSAALSCVRNGFICFFIATAAATIDPLIRSSLPLGMPWIFLA
jgi:hypothetical protein